MKTKIINILYHPPAYEHFHSEKRPGIIFNTNNGTWVTIKNDEWPDLLGNEVLKLTDEFEYEVWQPDPRADKIYSHRFENGLVHKLFPARLKTSLYKGKIEKIIKSNTLLKAIEKEMNNEQIILNINSSPLIYLNFKIIKKFHYLPIVLTFHGNFTDYLQYTKCKNLIKRIYRCYKRHMFIKQLNRVETITYQNKFQQDILLNLGIKESKISFLTMGVDFNLWKPASIIEAKKYFNINNKTTVFSMASRFNNLKQIDKVMQVFTELNSDNNYHFKLMIAGHGEKEYEDYLKSISGDLLKKDKLIFTGYLHDEKMCKLYQASDLFISASTSEGCSVSVIKALACEVPIFSTNVGGTSEVLRENNAGILVDPFDYKQWEKELIEILEGKRVPILDREIAKGYFHWPNIAKKFVKIYNELKKEKY